MRDLRFKKEPSSSNEYFRGRIIQADYKVNPENSVKQLFHTMGVSYDDDLIQEAIGYFSTHSMEINMMSLYSFLKGKSILSKRMDLRQVKKN